MHYAVRRKQTDRQLDQDPSDREIVLMTTFVFYR
jgi:hypothetical protein